FDARNERAHSEETTRNGNSELSGGLIADNDRPGHASHPPVRRSKGSKWARCSAMHVTHALWVATSVYRISFLLPHEPVAVGCDLPSASMRADSAAINHPTRP